MSSNDDEFWGNLTKDQKKKLTSEVQTEKLEEVQKKLEQSTGITSDDPFASTATEETIEEVKTEETESEPKQTEPELIKCGICGKDLDLAKSRSDNGAPVHGKCLINKTQKEVEQEKVKIKETQLTDDPFASTETEEEQTSVAEVPVTEVPVTVKGDPFVDTNQISQEDEFKKTKPASSGSNVSFLIFGKKGTSKTVTGMGLPGKIFVISMDQQSAIIHEEFFDNDPRIEVWDGIEFFNSKDPETKLETAVKTVEYVNWLLENPCIKFEPDWILIDGTERLTHVCEMAMRSQENLLPYEGVKNRNAWKYRNDLINNVVQRAAQIAKLGVVYTAYTNIETVTTATGEEKREGPKWAGDIEQKTQIVIKTSSERIQNGRNFTAEVESSKVSFIPIGRRIVVGERLNTGEIQNYVGIKGLFTPKGVKKYFSEVSNND